MGQIFVVTRSRGPAWESARCLEEQQDWLAHASFMNGLESERFVLLGGPLEGTPDVLLIVRAQDDRAIHAKLAADPWALNGLLIVTRVVPWSLRLGSLGS